MIAITSTFKTILASGKYTDADRVLLLKWLIDRSVQLPERLDLIAEVLGEDQDTIDKAFARQRTSHVDRQRRYRDRQNKSDVSQASQASQASHTVTGVNDASDANDAPLPPSLPPSPNDNMCVPRSRTCEKKPPTLDAVLLHGRADFRRSPAEVIPEEFCRTWFIQMQNAEPPWHNTRGISVLENWKLQLEFAWKNEKKFSATKTASGRDGIRRGTFAQQTENKRGLD